MNLSTAQAAHLAALAVRCIGVEFPNKLDHVLVDAATSQTPRRLHPAFYGCFDWHSFERTYGWAWLLKLAAELHTWDDGGARQ